MSALVVAESYPGYRYHLRRLGPREAPIKLGGHASPKPRALCGREIAWDTKIPVPVDLSSMASWRDGCQRCVDVAVAEIE
jgi:hypothetical protein